MITITTIFILLYTYSIYKIKKDSGSWKNFNPFDTNYITYMIFAMCTILIVMLIGAFIGYLTVNGILP